MRAELMEAPFHDCVFGAHSRHEVHGAGDKESMALREADAILIEPAPTATDEVRALVEELEAVLWAEYPREQRHGLSLDAIFQPPIRFFLARLDGVAVGCGGVALFPDFAEVKRMYVRDAVRGRGVAQALLARLETTAADAGLSVLRLE